MNIQLKPIDLNEKSYDVALLHKILEVFGLPVAENEVVQHRAGEDTEKKVRALQAKLDVPIDETMLVDDVAIAAIGEALRKRGFLQAQRSFTVSGTVRGADGATKRHQHLIAFDIDLRAVSVYHEVGTLAEIAGSGGFECLGTTTSDLRGRYELTFYDWQYKRAERGLADVVVYAVMLEDDDQDDPNGVPGKRGKGGKQGKQGKPGKPGKTIDGRILGRSRLVATDDYSEKGLVQDLDIILADADLGTEYDLVMTPVNAFLEENELTLHEIAPSSEQLAFTASELDINLDRMNVAAAATLLAHDKEPPFPHELLYAIGRQNVRLDWKVLYRKPAVELQAAIAQSVQDSIVRQFPDEEIVGFVSELREHAAVHVLTDEPTADQNTVNAMLSNALPEESQRLAFLRTLASFRGVSYSDFWRETLPAQPEFEGNPELIAGLLLNQQLTVLTGNHQVLVKELQVERGLDSVEQLLDLEADDWVEVVTKTGTPAGVPGDTEEARTRAYAVQLQNLVNAALPTQCIARMLEKNQLPIENSVVVTGISEFLAQNAQFDFTRSRIHDFSEEIAAAAPEQTAAVTDELLKIQRVFQVSPSPAAMTALVETGLDSAYSIASVPRRSFINTYADVLGGEQTAYTVHQRASHIAARAELTAVHLLEYSHASTPAMVMGDDEYTTAMALLESHIPNYTELFGRPDVCECEHCRSVYSAAAYFVDLLRFLWRSDPNAVGKTPLDLLAARRPDLLHLPLTCENTNTIIPYVDVVNEVMEYYTANDSLTGFEGYDTADATEAELRANPQNIELEAYRKLKDAKYPFTLPYHQPLDAIRTYSDHLGVSRYDAMRAVNPTPASAIAAESLRLSEEEYTIIAGAAFDGSVD